MDPDFLFLVILGFMVYLAIKLTSINRRLRELDPDRFEHRFDELRSLIRSLSASSRPAAPRADEPAPQPPPTAARIPAAQPAAAQPPPVPSPQLPPRLATPAPTQAPAMARKVTPPSPVPASAPTPAPAPSKFVQSVQEVCSKIWQWILVGEEYRPKGVTLEYAVATTWLMRAGAIALVACAGFFLKWSVDRDLLGPSMRVGLSTFFGLAMLIGGMRLLGKHLNILGQGLVGGGLATLYFSVYALGPWFHLVDSQVLVFGLMILITVAAGVLSLFANSMLVAILGIIGGFCTPILLSTGHPNFIGLYGYLLLLNIGILGIADLRQWRLLNYLGFVFTYAYVVGFAFTNQYPREDFSLILLLLSLLFIVHSTLVFLYNIRGRRPATTLEVIHLSLNAAIFSACAYDLILETHGRPWPALLTLGLALYYVAHVVLFLRSRLADRPLLVTFISLAGFFTTMTMPLAMEKESLTIAWSLQAFMFLWIGRRLGSNFLRHTAYALYAISLWRVLGFELPRLHPIQPGQEALYWDALPRRLWTFGASIGSILAAYLIERKQPPAPPDSILDRSSDTPDVAPSSTMRTAFFWGTAVSLFLYLNVELYTMFGLCPAWRPSAMTLLWCGAGVFFLMGYLSTGAVPLLSALLFLAMAVISKTLFWDAVVWNLCGGLYFDVPYSLASASARWLGLATVLAFLAACALLSARRVGTPIAAALFGYLSLALLWLYSSAELNTLLHWKLPEFQAGGISVLWTLFAFGFLAGGIWKNVRGVRYAGLTLFAVVVAKVFLSDLANMPALYRVLAFMVLGILLLLGSYAYLRASKRFIKGE